MVQKIRYLSIALSLSLLLITTTYGQKHFSKNPHVTYTVTEVDDQIIINYTFKDHYNKIQHYTLRLPLNFTKNEIAVFGIPQWLFEPYSDTEYNRMVRNQAIAAGLFMIDGNKIEVDKSAVIEYYAETFCKPVAEMIIQSLKEYERDTRRDRIEMAMRFVQDIPYGIPDYADAQRHFGGASPPPGVLCNGYGDCDSKALLFASIIIYLIPAEEFIFLNQPDHVLSAIKEEAKEGTTFVRYNGIKFLLAETAGPAKRSLGEKGDYFRNGWEVEPLRIDAPAILPYQSQVSNRLPVTIEEPIEKNLLVIQNSSQRILHFQLSPDGSRWKKFTLNENSSGHYRFENETPVYIKLQDNIEKSSDLKLNTGNTYKLSFNKIRKMWEFY